MVEYNSESGRLTESADGKTPFLRLILPIRCHILSETKL
jgi:hypothetical protein